MKKIKTIRKFKDDMNYYLGMGIIVIFWGILGSIVIYNIIPKIDLYSFEGFIMTFFNSRIEWAIVLLGIPVYFLYSYFKELIYPKKYIGKLKNIKNGIYEDKNVYKLEFELNLESTGKTTELIGDKLECLINDNINLEKNKEYLISLTPNYAVKNIYEYDKNYKNISNKNVSMNMGIVFGIMYFIFGFMIVSSVINLIYETLNDNLFYSKNIMYLLIIIVCALITHRIYKVHKRYNTSVDTELQKEKKNDYNKQINLEKNNYPYGTSIISLFVKSNLLHGTYKVFGPMLLAFMIIYIIEKDFFGALFFILFGCIIFSITYLLYFVLCVYKNLDGVKFKKLGIRNNKKIDLDKVEEFVLIKSLNKFYVVDSNSNLVMNVRPNASFKQSFYVGDSFYKLIGVIKNKSFLEDELMIYSENNKPFMCDRKTYPTFEFDLTGIDYSIECVEKARTYLIKDKEEKIVSSINCINYKNTKWTYVGCAGIKLNNNKKDTINLLLISLSIIIGNLELINEGNEALIKTDKNGLTVYERD